MDTKKIFIIFSLLLTLPAWAGAEVITLRDGTKIEAAKVWEDNGYIKFSPKGYEGVVITYDRDIVERIGDRQIAPPPAPADPAPEAEEPRAVEAAPPAPATAGTAPATPQPPAETAPVNPPQPAPPPPAATSTAPAAAAPVQTPAPPPAPTPPPQPAPGAAAPDPAPEVATENRAFAQYDGIQFYDPRRTYKYRTGPETWHRTFQEAVAALALTFDSPPEWIEQNIGNTNDLGQIYRNLQGSKSSPAGVASASGSQIDGIPFYDPRRQYKYWVSESAKHRNLEDALADLAKQYGRSTGWIQENIGDSNDLGQIHRNLQQRKLEEERQSKKMN